MVNKIIKVAAQLGEYLRIVRAFLKAYEVFILELNNGKALPEFEKNENE